MKLSLNLPLLSLYKKKAWPLSSFFETCHLNQEFKWEVLSRPFYTSSHAYCRYKVGDSFSKTNMYFVFYSFSPYPSEDWNILSTSIISVNQLDILEIVLQEHMLFYMFMSPHILFRVALECIVQYLFIHAFLPYFLLRRFVRVCPTPYLYCFMGLEGISNNKSINSMSTQNSMSLEAHSRKSSAVPTELN